MAQLVKPEQMFGSRRTLDPSNLKSFQRISEEDMRYLAELAKFRSQSLAEEGESLQEGIPPRQRWRALAISMRKIFRRLKNKILYETVPTDDTYS